MKLLLTMIILFFATNTFAQKAKHKPRQTKVKRKTVTVEEDIVFQKIETEAGFIGGLDSLEKFIQTNLKADVPTINAAPAGKYTVLVKFTICKDGSLNNFVLENNPGYGTGEEVIRLLKTSPNWRPLETGGLKVNAIYRQTINFVVF